MLQEGPVFRGLEIRRRAYSLKTGYALSIARERHAIPALLYVTCETGCACFRPTISDDQRLQTKS